MIGTLTFDEEKNLIHKNYQKNKSDGPELLDQIAESGLFKKALGKVYDNERPNLSYIDIKGKTYRVANIPGFDDDGFLTHIFSVVTNLNTVLRDFHKTIGTRVILRTGQHYVGVKGSYEKKNLKVHNYEFQTKQQDKTQTWLIKHIPLDKNIFSQDAQLFIFQNEEKIQSITNALITTTIVGGLIMLILAFFAGYGFSNNLNKPLEASLKEVEAISSDLQRESKHLESASGSLLDATSNQSVSLEETSAMVSSISSMVKRTADNTRQTQQNVVDANQATKEGFVKIDELTKAVSDISNSNERLKDMAKLIRDIDSKTQAINEIVFNTKILSFNAAVEAHRAGLHGDGFTVIANQIRKLALTSGEASTEIQKIVNSGYKDINHIIDNTSETIFEGQEVSFETLNSFKDIQDNVSSISNQVNRISKDVTSQEKLVSMTEKTTSELNESATYIFSKANELKTESDKLQGYAGRLRHRVHDLGNFLTGEKNNAISQDKSKKAS